MISLWLWHNQKLKICECWTKMAGCCGRKQTAHTWTDPRFALPPCPHLSSRALPWPLPYKHQKQKKEKKDRKGTERKEKKRKAPPSNLMRFSLCFGCHLSRFCACLLLLSDNLWLLLLFLLFLITCVSYVIRSLQVLFPLSSPVHCCPLLPLTVIFSSCVCFPLSISSLCAVLCQVLVPGLCCVAYVQTNHTRNSLPPRNTHDLMHMLRVCAIIDQK